MANNFRPSAHWLVSFIEDRVNWVLGLLNLGDLREQLWNLHMSTQGDHLSVVQGAKDLLFIKSQRDRHPPEVRKNCQSNCTSDNMTQRITIRHHCQHVQEHFTLNVGLCMKSIHRLSYSVPAFQEAISVKIFYLKHSTLYCADPNQSFFKA